MNTKKLRNIILGATCLGLSCTQKPIPQPAYIQGESLIINGTGKERVEEVKNYLRVYAANNLKNHKIHQKDREVTYYASINCKELTYSIILTDNIAGRSTLLLGYSSKDQQDSIVAFEDIHADGIHEEKIKMDFEYNTKPASSSDILTLKNIQQNQEEYEKHLSVLIEKYWWN